MATVKLELINKDGDTILKTKEGTTGRDLRKALETMEKMQDEESQLKQLDGMIDYVVEVFDDPKVTPDAILDSIPSEKLLPTLQDIIGEITGEKEDDGTGKK